MLDVLDVEDIAGLVGKHVGDFAVGVWKSNEDAANLFAYCRSSRDRVGEGRWTRIEVDGGFVDVDVDVDDGVDSPGRPDNSPW